MLVNIVTAGYILHRLIIEVHRVIASAQDIQMDAITVLTSIVSLIFSKYFGSVFVPSETIR